MDVLHIYESTIGIKKIAIDMMCVVCVCVAFWTYRKAIADLYYEYQRDIFSENRQAHSYTHKHVSRLFFFLTTTWSQLYLFFDEIKIKPKVKKSLKILKNDNGT